LTLETTVDQKTGRKCYLDLPSDYSPGEEVILTLTLHGGRVDFGASVVSFGQFAVERSH
jgi:hypothetical protein